MGRLASRQLFALQVEPSEHSGATHYQVAVGAHVHRLRFEAGAADGLMPYLHVRADLWAKLTRALYYDLVDIGEERMIDGQRMFGIESGGEFFPMANAEQMRAAL